MSKYNKITVSAAAARALHLLIIIKTFNKKLYSVSQKKNLTENNPITRLLRSHNRTA